ncbi:MAG: hypothetical protein J6L96_04955, partial [Clostridia bacterium]|nr:hypothetical protein [Clostridia bacterium]
MSGEKSKRRLTAIDYFIILAVAAVLIAAGLRVYANNIKKAPEPIPVVEEEYLISFERKGINESEANLLEVGDTFYFSGGQKEFGVLEEKYQNPAKTSIEMADGTLKKDVLTVENGNLTKADVTGTFKVKGFRNDNKLMYVGGTYIAPNMSITLYSEDMAFQ